MSKKKRFEKKEKNCMAFKKKKEPEKKTELEKQTVLKAGKFVLVLLFVLVVFGGLVFLVSAAPFKALTALTSSAVLQGMGVLNSVEGGEDAYIVLENREKTVIVINELCTGILETMILVAAIIATMEIHWKKRAIGAVAAVIGIFLFNQIRIVSTVFFILNAPIDLVVLSHDVFFRVFLFVTIAVFYWAFLRWGKKPALSKSHKK